jgi:hypothetical protein
MNDYEFIMIDEILKHQTDYFHRWYDIFYKPNYNYPQYKYLSFNKDHTFIAYNDFSDGIELFKRTLYVIFIENKSWFILAKSICILRLNRKKGNMSDEEFKELLSEMELWFNLTALECNDISMDYTIVKTTMNIYGYEKAVNFKR